MIIHNVVTYIDRYIHTFGGLIDEHLHIQTTNVSGLMHSGLRSPCCLLLLQDDLIFDFVIMYVILECW